MAPHDRQLTSHGFRDAGGTHDATVSLAFLLWVLIAPLVGFLLAELGVLGGDGAWVTWRAALLGSVLLVPFAVGAYFGVRAIRGHQRGGWVGLIGNVALSVLAIAMPISESLSSS